MENRLPIFKSSFLAHNMRFSIGNDIVDLSEIEPDLHNRYISRVFTKLEQVKISQDPSKLWLFWAAKEAAYKALKRIDPQLIFSPQLFEFDAPDTVRYMGQLLKCKITQAGHFYHVLCSTVQEALENCMVWIDDSVDHVSGSHSARIRQLAVENIAKVLNVSAHLLEIASADSRAAAKEWTSVPVLLVNGSPSAHKISFSHHGRFLACAFTPSK